jgi:hypothetical protein
MWFSIYLTNYNCRTACSHNKIKVMALSTTDIKQVSQNSLNGSRIIAYLHISIDLRYYRFFARLVFVAIGGGGGGGGGASSPHFTTSPLVVNVMSQPILLVSVIEKQGQLK